MPKNQIICPTESRRSGTLEFAPIPLNQYQKTCKEEFAAKRFSKADLLRIQRDMDDHPRPSRTCSTRSSCSGTYKGIEYNHRGPAHLSIGQEAAAVGQAYLLDADDHIFGSPPQPRRDSRQGPLRDRTSSTTRR